jgi:dihydroneopterin aldolase
MDFIFIEQCRVEAFVGVYPRELIAAQTLEISMTFGLPQAKIDDKLDQTIDYACVLDAVRQTLGQKRFNLLESVGEHIAQLLCEDFAAPWVEVKVAKLGIVKGVHRVGVHIERGQR